MIGRNKADYSKKFTEAGLKIKEEVEFTEEMKDLGLLPMCFWILETWEAQYNTSKTKRLKQVKYILVKYLK